MTDGQWHETSILFGPQILFIDVLFFSTRTADQRWPDCNTRFIHYSFTRRTSFFFELVKIVRKQRQCLLTNAASQHKPRLLILKPMRRISGLSSAETSPFFGKELAAQVRPIRPIPDS